MSKSMIAGRTLGNDGRFFHALFLCRICDHKTDRPFSFGFRKLLMLKVRFLDPPPFSFGFVQFWLGNREPLMDSNEHQCRKKPRMKARERLNR